MGFLLHELIPLNLGKQHPSQWQICEERNDKDLLCLADDKFSVEIKTSSHKDQIFGNRSYAQKGATEGKAKSGYYLMINFGKFAEEGRPEIIRIRFGYVDHSDWIGQASQTGQQSRLKPEVYTLKTKILYPT